MPWCTSSQHCSSTAQLPRNQHSPSLHPQSHHSLIILAAPGFTVFFLLFWKNRKFPPLSQNSSQPPTHSHSFTSGLSPAQMVEGQALTAGLAAQQQGCHYFKFNSNRDTGMNVQNKNCFPKLGLISLYKLTEKMSVRWRAAGITLEEVRHRVIASPESQIATGTQHCSL